MSKNQINRIIPGAKVLRGIEKEAIKEYMSELDFAISNKDINNVSLSGGYGTGKSSIVKTFIDSKKILNKEKYIVISIGSFLKYKTIEYNNENPKETVKKDNNIEDINKKETQEFQIQKIEEGVKNINNQKFNDSDGIIDKDELNMVDKIEESILKQLVHINYSNEMPYSNLQRLNRNIGKYVFILDTIFILFNLLVFFITSKNSQTFIFLEELVNNSFLKIFTKNSLLYLVMLFVSILICASLCIEKIIYSRIAGKIKTEVADIEIKNIDDLPFNQKIYEILYFFSVNKIKAVFFEDIDRFSKDVVMLAMEELKELNSIINSSKAIRNKVTFIYEFKDNIFENYEQRNKFYDYNISVMPLSTKNNSSYLLDGLCSNACIDLDLIKIVSNHLTDYRTMVNIINDFYLFKKNLNLPDNERNQLFAVIVYKNVYIQEYNQLHCPKNELDEKIIVINDKIASAYKSIKEQLKNIEILKEKAIIYELNGYKINYYSIYSLYEHDSEGNVLYEGEDLKSVSKDEFLKLSEENLLNDNFKAIDKKLLSMVKTFWDDSQKYDSLDKYIWKLKASKGAIENRPNSNIFDIENIGEKGKSLEDDLIISGYLNDNYLDYISRPVNNDVLSGEDCRYMNRVIHGFDASNFRLKHCESIIRYIDSNDYSNLRNYDMIEYLCKKDYRTSNEKLFLWNISIEFRSLDIDKIEFLTYYFENNKQDIFRLFVKECLDYYDFSESLIEFYNSMEETNQIDINTFLLEILKIEKLKYTNHSYKSLREYINGSDLLLKCNLDNNVELNNLLFLKLRIKDVTKIIKESARLSLFVYENNLYSFSPINIKIMDLSFKSKYTTFESYVLSNLQLFFDECYKIDKSIYIKKISVINKMLKSGIDLDSKKSLMIREDFTTDYFELDLLEEAYNYNHIKLKWDSIKKYYNKCKERDKTITNKTLERILQLIMDNILTLSVPINKNELIVDVEFNQLLIRILMEENLLNIAEKYLELLDDDIVIENINNLGKEAIEFGIEKKLFAISTPIVKSITYNSEISVKKKCSLFNDIYHSKGMCPLMNLIKSNENLVKMFISNKELSEQLEILEKLELSSELLKSIYPIIFKKDRNDVVSLKQYNKIIRANENMFTISKIGYKYRVSLK